jgi:oxaloacetate decarboxylase gamma subunit
MEANLFQQGVNLMLYGMGTVFVFLALLISATALMSFLVQRFHKEEPPVAAGGRAAPAVHQNEQLVAVITAAIHKYRSRHKR